MYINTVRQIPATKPLQINQGEIKARVKGSSVYIVKINITPVPSKQWNQLIKECAGQIDSLIELLLGQFSKNVMGIMTHPKKGLFPRSNEIKLSCSCPDWADLCKHTAAVLYGIGARFDERPENLFLLRQTNHLELISKASITPLSQTDKEQDGILKDADLSALFGVNIEKSAQAIASSKQTPRIKISTFPKNKAQQRKLKSAAGKVQGKKANHKSLVALKATGTMRKSKNKKHK